MVRSRMVISLGAASLAALLFTSACSSGRSSSGASTSASSNAGGSSTSASGAAGAPIRIGVLCSCSGPFGTTIAAAYKVMQAWADSVNAAGGINGHPVSLLEKDNQSNPANAVTDAQELISAKVPVIVDLDILDETWQKAVDAAHIPVVGGAIAGVPYTNDANFYPSGQTNDSVIYSILATAKTAGATKLAFMYCAESPNCAQSIPLVKSAGTAVGVPDVYNASIAGTAPNYTAQCLAAKQAGATALFIADSTAVNTRVASDCNRQGYNPIYLAEGTGYQDQVLTTPGLKDNLWLSFPVLPYFSTAPAVAAMNAALDKYVPGTRTNALTWSEFAVTAWTGGLLVQAAAKNAGFGGTDTVTAADFTQGLEKVSGETLGGFSPTLTFTSASAHQVQCWYTARVQGGTPSQVGGQTCHPDS